MTLNAWIKIKRGSIIASQNGKNPRRVRCKGKNDRHGIKLTILRKSWTGKDTTTYCVNDRRNFKVIKY